MGRSGAVGGALSCLRQRASPRRAAITKNAEDERHCAPASHAARPSSSRAGWPQSARARSFHAPAAKGRIRRFCRLRLFPHTVLSYAISCPGPPAQGGEWLYLGASGIHRSMGREIETTQNCIIKKRSKDG